MIGFLSKITDRKNDRALHSRMRRRICCASKTMDQRHAGKSENNRKRPAVRNDAAETAADQRITPQITPERASEAISAQNSELKRDKEDQKMIITDHKRM